MSQLKIEKTFGVVAVLDALGTKDRWKRESPNSVIHKWEHLITNWRKAMKKTYKNRFDVSFHAFSDTVIITFSNGKTNYLMDAAGSEVSAFVMFALTNRIFFRGCMSVGKIFAGPQMVIGPAIDESAQFYESSDWIGVFLTSSAEKIVKKPSFQKLIKSEEFENCFKKYKIPLKSGTKNGFALNIKRDYEYLKWIMLLSARTKLPLKLETILNREMKKTSNQKILKKWKNTQKFFEITTSIPLDKILKKY